MKKAILAVAAASAVLAGPPSSARMALEPDDVIPTGAGVKPAVAVPVPMPKAARAAALPPRAPSVALATMAEALRELRGAAAGERDIARQMALYAAFEYSAPLKPRLLAVFGTDSPLLPRRVAGAQGGARGAVDYVASLAPHLYRESDTASAEWSGLLAQISFDRTGRKMNGTVSWSSLTLRDGDTTIAIRGMRGVSTGARGTDKVWYGSAGGTIDSVVVDGLKGTGGVGAGTGFRLDGIAVRSEATRRGKLTDLAQGFSIGRIGFAGDSVERFNFATRLQGLDTESLYKLADEIDKIDPALAPPRRQAAVLEKMTAFGKAALKQGPTLVIDDISAGYHGQTASLKGRLTLGKGADQDIGDFNKLLARLTAHFEFRLPVAMVREVSRTMASKGQGQGQGQGQGAVAAGAAEQVEAAARAMADSVVGKLVGGGYAVLVNGELRSAIDIKGGKLSFNGKLSAFDGMAPGQFIRIPQMPPGMKPVAPPAAPVSAPVPAPEAAAPAK